MNTVFESDLKKLKQKAIDKINLLFSANPEILFLTSGGSALELLAEIDRTLLNEHITITVLDERFSNDPAINNFLQLMETQFYRDARDKGCMFMDMWVMKNETIDKMAERFDLQLKNWKNLHPDGVIIATQGMGPDGHTSGIMPYPENPELFKELFENEKRWVTGYDAKDKNQYPLRVTTTTPFLKMIDHCIFYITGVNKKEALQRALNPDGQVYTIPAAIIQQMKDVTIFTDQNI